MSGQVRLFTLALSLFFTHQDATLFASWTELVPVDERVQMSVNTIACSLRDAMRRTTETTTAPIHSTRLIMAHVYLAAEFGRA